MSATSQTILLDGGMGRQLACMGAPFRQPEWSALALMEAPETVSLAHRQFIDAGAEVITTNSYALVPFHIGEARFASDGARLADLSGRLARQAADAANKRIAADAANKRITADAAGRPVKVAGSLPPLFGSYRPDLFDPAAAPRLLAVLTEGLARHADLWLAETQSSVIEAECAARAALARAAKPLWISYTLQDETDDPAIPRLRSGEPAGEAAEAALALGAEAVLFNCSQPEVMGAAIAAARQAASRAGREARIGVYANAFPPQTKKAEANAALSRLREDLDPASYLGWAQGWLAEGASIIGGCCGIGPEHIAHLKARLAV
jgi:S-methylmethionine-dependent homocysteine/selenocysteine methylase